MSVDRPLRERRYHRLRCRHDREHRPAHEQIARIALALPEAGQVALVGGGTMLANNLVDRPTEDVDLSTPNPFEVARLVDAPLVAACRRHQVRVDRRKPWGLANCLDLARRRDDDLV
jgi:hypothetical protein